MVICFRSKVILICIIKQAGITNKLNSYAIHGACPFFELSFKLCKLMSRDLASKALIKIYRIRINGP